MNTYVIASFYKFVPLAEFQSMKAPLLEVMKTYHLLGTIILSHEGINGSVSGTRDDIVRLYSHLHHIPALHDLKFKEMEENFLPFQKARVKFRKEIVTLGVPDVDPLQHPGKRVSPNEWNELISLPDVVVLDTRNDYEVSLGTFKNAVNPHTENFRDLPQYIERNLAKLQNKTIAMCCTGGIRCEKASAYLNTLGIHKVYQLEGGILNYLASIPPEKSLWEGSCFVFDDRIAVGE